jgi:hypothetical protein
MQELPEYPTPKQIREICEADRRGGPGAIATKNTTRAGAVFGSDRVRNLESNDSRLFLGPRLRRHQSRHTVIHHELPVMLPGMLHKAPRSF